MMDEIYIERILDSFERDIESILDVNGIELEDLLSLLIARGWINEETMPWIFEDLCLSNDEGDEFEEQTEEAPF